MNQRSTFFLDSPGLFTKILKSLVLVITVFAVTACKDGEGPSVGYNRSFAPKQPIAFDHSLHAGKYKIDCQYCHSNAEVSRHASVPSLNICMNCHLTVGQSDEIQKLRDAYNNNESIEWVKVHMLPDFVHFNHRRHVRRGVACQTCHGEVESMKVLSQHKDLSMGWCVDCHRKPENNAPTNCSTCHQ